MLIVLEGIDGAGKTTVAPLLHQRLGARFARSILICEKRIVTGDPSLDGHLESLRRLIWTRDERPVDSLKPRHWLALIAAWYHALQSCILDQYSGPRDLVVVDGWFYRNIIKTQLRLRCDPSPLERLFDGITAPQRTVLIDAVPASVWADRRSFKATELGRWDGYEGDPEASFTSYQGAIRAHLLDRARRDGWQVVRRSRSPTDTLAVIESGLFPSILSGNPLM